MLINKTFLTDNDFSDRDATAVMHKSRSLAIEKINRMAIGKNDYYSSMIHFDLDSFIEAQSKYVKTVRADCYGFNLSILKSMQNLKDKISKDNQK